MRKRDPLTAPNVGDRVPYVVIKGAKNAKVYEKVEDPIWVLQHSLPIDTTYYLKQQMYKPILRLFAPIMDKPDTLFTGDHTRNRKQIAPKTGTFLIYLIDLSIYPLLSYLHTRARADIHAYTDTKSNT